MDDRHGGTRERTREKGSCKILRMKGMGEEQKGVESNEGRKWRRKERAAWAIDREEQGRGQERRELQD